HRRDRADARQHPQADAGASDEKAGAAALAEAGRSLVARGAKQRQAFERSRILRAIRRRWYLRMPAAQVDAPRPEAEHADHRRDERDPPDQAALGFLWHIERVADDETGAAREGAADIAVPHDDGDDGRDETQDRSRDAQEQRAGADPDDAGKQHLRQAELTVGGVKLTRVIAANGARGRALLVQDGPRR